MDGSRPLTVALAVVLCTACAPTRPPHPDPAPALRSARPVGVITEGSAFARAGVRERVVDTIQRLVQRPAVSIDLPASPGDPTMTSLAARLVKEYPATAAYDRREPQCAADFAVLTGLERDVDGVYRVSLDHTERSRPASAAEAAQPRAPRRTFGNLFGLLDSGSPRSALEESLSGTITASAFTVSGRSRRARISLRATHVGATARTPRLDAAAAVTDAMRGFPALSEPQWEELARRFASSGCPFLALAVCEMRLKGSRTERSVRTAALASMRNSLRRRAAQKLASQKRTPEPAPAPAAASGDATETETSAGQGPYSCAALCEMHMVEICNHDKVLWSSHRKEWEPTPCGMQRPDAFLVECYEQQRVSGTFRDSCLLPCESAAEGRDGLITILQGAGCLRAGPS